MKLTIYPSTHQVLAWSSMKRACKFQNKHQRMYSFILVLTVIAVSMQGLCQFMLRPVNACSSPREKHLTPQSNATKVWSKIQNSRKSRQMQKKKPSRKEVEEQKSKKNKWRQEHDQLMNAMQAAKGGESAPAPVDPSLVPCPHCNRRFNKNSAARHIKICESVFSKNTHKSKRPAAARGQPKVGRR